MGKSFRVGQRTASTGSKLLPFRNDARYARAFCPLRVHLALKSCRCPALALLRTTGSSSRLLAMPVLRTRVRKSRGHISGHGISAMIVDFLGHEAVAAAVRVSGPEFGAQANRTASNS